jgi:hypothetical protein
MTVISRLCVHVITRDRCHMSIQSWSLLPVLCFPFARATFDRFSPSFARLLTFAFTLHRYLLEHLHPSPSNHRHLTTTKYKNNL